jgi:predicted nucleic acid-binding protein
MILYVTSQNFMEFWNVATRPANRNGFGLTPQQAEMKIQVLERQFIRLPDTDSIFDKWRELSLKFNVSGVQVHDTRLVASMLVHNITYILTFNTADFNRFASEGIVPIDPANI